MSCSCFGTSLVLQKRRDKHANESVQDEEGKHLIDLLHGKKFMNLPCSDS